MKTILEINNRISQIRVTDVKIMFLNYSHIFEDIQEETSGTITYHSEQGEHQAQ